MDPTNPKYWALLRKRAMLERRSRVEVAMLTSDAKYLLVGGPLDPPSLPGYTSSQTSSASPTEVAEVLSSSASPSQARVPAERDGVSPSGELPVFSYETCQCTDESVLPKGGAGQRLQQQQEEEEARKEPLSLSAARPPLQEGSRAGAVGGRAREEGEEVEEDDSGGVVNRSALMDEECYKSVEAYLDETLGGLASKKDGYRYKVTALASRLLKQPQLQYFDGQRHQQDCHGTGVRQAFDTQVAYYDAGVRQALVKKGDLPPDAKLVGIHDCIMTDLAAVTLGHSAVQDD